MGTKQNPGKYDCYDKAEPDEPIFVLLARDPFAAGAVREWAMFSASTQPEEKIDEAHALADAMDAWRVKRFGR